MSANPDDMATHRANAGYLEAIFFAATVSRLRALLRVAAKSGLPLARARTLMRLAAKALELRP